MAHPLDRSFATDTAYLVLQKQRRELQGAHLSPEQSSQGSDVVTLSGTRGEIARSFFSEPFDGDSFDVNPPRMAVGDREGNR